jgi:membrane fusion protein, multidrug efflux system
VFDAELRVSEFEGKSADQRIGPDHQLNAPPKSGNSWILWTLLILVLVAGAYYFLHVRGSSKTAKSAPSAGGGAGGRRGMTGPVPVTVATATKGNIGVYLDALGTVTPVYTDSITAQVTGVLTAVNYKEGQFVHKGDSLIEIDPRPNEATLAEAQGTLERDQGVLAQAQMDLERYRAAWARNGINKQLLDDQEKIVVQDQGTVKLDQGTVQFDQVQLSFCHIASPISGQAGFRLVDPGNLVQANGTNPLVVITQMQPTTVIFTLAEDSLGQVEARMRKTHSLPVEAWDRNSTNKLADGKLLTINNQIDTTTGTVKLRATFDNKNIALFPNQFVNTRLLVNTQDGVTLIPSGAVQHNGQVAFVYVIDTAKNVASVQNVKTGVSDAGQIAVQGINPGTVVATSSFEKLQAGSQIRVSKQAIAPNPGEDNTP